MGCRKLLPFDQQFFLHLDGGALLAVYISQELVKMRSRMQKYWVYGGLPAGIMLLVLTPALIDGWPLAMTAVFLQLPIYMLHQFEEHDNDCFRRYVNTHVGGGLEVLSSAAVWVVNVPGVWGVNTASILLVWAVNPGLGLIGIYLSLVNAIVHVVQGIHAKSYNPGLVTAILLLFPASVFGLWAVHRTGGGTLTSHLVGIGVAVLIHVAIIVYVVQTKVRLVKSVTQGKGADIKSE